MRGVLPQMIDVERLALKRERLEGAFALSGLERLAEMATGPDGEVGFELDFFRDDQGRVRISGSIQGNLTLTCQRCLQPVRQELIATVELMALTDESALTQLPGDLEPLITDGRPVRLMDLIEDEALLALPIVALHGQCSSPLHDQSGERDGHAFETLMGKE